MATLAEQYALATDQTFLGRVAMAIETKAVAIAAESSPGLNPPRKKLAIRVLRDPVVEAPQLALVVARDATIAAKSPLDNGAVADTEISDALSDAVWDGYAEAFA
jgi:hypothetical protein